MEASVSAHMSLHLKNVDIAARFHVMDDGTSWLSIEKALQGTGVSIFMSREQVEKLLHDIKNSLECEHKRPVVVGAQR